MAAKANKNILKWIMIPLLIAGAAYAFFRRNSNLESGVVTADPDTGGNEIPAPVGACIHPDRIKFPTRWTRTEEIAAERGGSGIPHGDVKRFGEMYIGIEEDYGNRVAGFFKAIDLFPNAGAAKLYQSDLKAWVLSNQGLDYWHIRRGERLCEPIPLPAGDAASSNLRRYRHYS